MSSQIIIELNSKSFSPNIGNKAQNLIYLKQVKDLNVPKTWVIPWSLQQEYKNDQESTARKLFFEIKNHLDPQGSYAVRSSSNIEDSRSYSFAGLFKSFLNVQGYQNLINKIIEIWSAINAGNVLDYINKFSLSPEKIKMSVIIQEMITPVFSGVCFSVNPMTGSSEIVLESVSGKGTALVQDGATPERWISHGGNWIAKPDKNELPMEIADQIINTTKKLGKKFKKPIDLEWVYNGQSVYWVQMREITTIEDLNIYSNRISKDVMPGIIHPLIWSINVPLINTIWLALLEEMVGPLSIKPEDLSKSFYYRSYFNMGAIGQVFSTIGFPSESLEMMMGIVPNQEGRPIVKPTIKILRYIPRLIGFLYDKWFFHSKIESNLPKIWVEMQDFSPYPDPTVSIETQLIDINRLFTILQKNVYFNVVTPLLESLYARLLEKQLQKFGINLLQFNLLENLPEMGEFDLNLALTTLRDEYDNLTLEKKELVLQELVSGEIQLNSFQGFKAILLDFIKRFGHLSDNSNNFMAKPWRENPEYILEMIQDYEDPKRSKGTLIGFDDLGLKGLRKMITRLFYNRTRRFTIYREMVSRQYAYGYGLFRPYFFRLADWMIAEGWLEKHEDIFFLNWDEIQNAILEESGGELYEIIYERRDEMETIKDIRLPDIIYGDEAPPIFSEYFERMYGTPTSQGYYIGSIKVVFGREEFDKVERGDVIVIPYSDVGWTPLFARAGAVIAESGGILSHSSIIAREYQIPAIVSVSNCMQLKDHQRVSVNGFTGEIIILKS